MSSIIHRSHLVLWATSWQNEQSGMCTQRRLGSAWAEPGHPPSLIRVFAVRMKKAWVLSYPLSAQQRLWSDWADAQADLSLHWAHMPLCWFCHEAAFIIRGLLFLVSCMTYSWSLHFFMWKTTMFPFFQNTIIGPSLKNFLFALPLSCIFWLGM